MVALPKDFDIVSQTNSNVTNRLLANNAYTLIAIGGVFAVAILLIFRARGRSVK